MCPHYESSQIFIFTTRAKRGPASCYTRAGRTSAAANSNALPLPTLVLGVAALIELDNVRKSFDEGRTFAVRDATLRVAPTEFVAVVGASGSGKTTTLKFINRLIDPDGGEVKIEGELVNAVTPSELRRRIGYVFQGIGLFPHMSVGENIGVTPRLL